VVVLNLLPEFSAPLGSPVLDFLKGRYPHARRYGWFEVRWRDEVAAAPAGR